MRRTQQASAI